MGSTIILMNISLYMYIYEEELLIDVSNRDFIVETYTAKQLRGMLVPLI